ncbi:MAG: BTAD domain-containing putative transcriptional regulator [Desulfobacter sp.]
MPVLTCQFLGSPCFSVNGRPVKPDRRKSVALAAYLAVTGTTVSRERLADLFWPDYSHENARASLRRTLSAMAKVLGRFWFAADRDAISFIPHENIQVDVTRFRTWAQQAPATRPVSPTPLEQAVRIYGGAFLSGFTLPDAPDFDDWQFARKEELERRYISVLKRLVRIYADQGNDAGAIEHASAWATADPLDESAHRHLIRLYTRSGHKGLALRQYDRCCRLLNTELGIAPAPETKDLARRLHILPNASPEKKQPHGPVLPERTGPFIGREKEIREITTQLLGSGTRLVTLTGPGGIGKTRLAMEAAAVLENRFSPDIFFLSLTDTDSIDGITARLSKRLGFSPDPGQDALRQAMDFLHRRKALVVLDNLEHLSGAARFISGILERTDRVKLLATSRARLGLSREQVFSLSGLPCPCAGQTGDSGRLQRVCNADSTALFLSAIHRVQPDFRPSPNNIDDIVRICRLTSGMPLALILAGGWGDVLSPGEIADEIEADIDFLRSDHRDIPPNHRSMRAVFDTSWHRLSRQEQDVFAGLSVFRGQFSRKAAAAVAGMPGKPEHNKILASLVRKSLVNMSRAGSGAATYTLHPLLHQYAGEKHASSGSKDETLKRHEDYYLGLVRDCGKELISPGMLDCRTIMDTAFPNIEQAWSGAVDRGDMTALSRAATGLYVYFDMHTRYREGERLFRAAKEAAFRFSEPSVIPDAGQILLCWFDMQVQSSDTPVRLQETRAWAHEWLRQAVKSRDSHSRAPALLLMGAIAHYQEHHDRAVRLYRLGLGHDSGIENAFWVTMRIGLCHKAQNRMDQALAGFEKSLKIGRELGDTVKIAWSLGKTGSAHLCLGHMETARSYLLSARDAFERIKAPVGLITCLEELGLIALFNGEFDRVIRLADQALAQAEDAGFSHTSFQRAPALKGLGQVMAGNPDQGLTLFRELEQTGSPGLTVCLGLCFSAVRSRDRHGAAYYEKAARSLAANLHKPQFTALLYLARSAVSALHGDHEAAAQYSARAAGHTYCPWGFFNAWSSLASSA